MRFREAETKKELFRAPIDPKRYKIWHVSERCCGEMNNTHLGLDRLTNSYTCHKQENSSSCAKAKHLALIVVCVSHERSCSFWCTGCFEAWSSCLVLGSCLPVCRVWAFACPYVLFGFDGCLGFVVLGAVARVLTWTHHLT